MKYNALRQAGVLLHISSLPSKYGCGGCGKETYDFLKTIKSAGFSLWQVLPLCPLGFGNSPYSSISAFAGNELFIDLDLLIDEGLLKKSDVTEYKGDKGRVNWDFLREYKMPSLKIGAKNLIKKLETNTKLLSAYNAFKESSSYWLYDYALFRVLSDKYSTSSWNISWSDDEKMRSKTAIERLLKEKGDEIEVWMALQFIFYKQWKDVKRFANELGIKIIGDMPYCSSKDSAEVWAHPELFYFDEKMRVKKVVGVPPDAFSETGQLWGNPQYNWSEHKKENFRFWIERVKSQLQLFDYLRLDHFRGFVSSWTVDAKERTAVNGKWVKSEGDLLFKTLYKEFKINEDYNPFIAEDLGVITDDVVALREKLSLPSLRVMEFGFNHGNDDPHLPHMWDENVIGYLGTHDNNTLIGWWENDASPYERDRVKRYMYANDESAPWYMMRALVASRAPIVMFSMQDLMFLGSDARFNTPGVVSDKNWTYRITSSFDTEKFKNLLQMFARA